MRDGMTPKVLFLILVIAFSGPGKAAAQTALERVKIAVSSRSIAFIDLYIAQDRSFFREEGLNAELIQVSANVATAALVSGKWTLWVR
jgi:ABC-type nitrate/sulfonate/bicarbonate transport system substrate-binding protein